MIEKCKRCGRFIDLINVGTCDKPKWVKDKVDGYGNDVFCGYCASTCFFINGMMYSMEEVMKLNYLGILPTII